jgi:hypothetical protein
MRILRPIVEAAADLLPICGADLIHRRRIRAKAVRFDNGRLQIGNGGRLRIGMSKGFK